MTKLKLPKRYFRVGEKKVERPTTERKKIFDEFEKYQKRNYNLEPVVCPCRNDNSYLISNIDREGWEYPLVICKTCGLIRAREYWDNKSLNHFYSNWYRKKYGVEERPNKFYNEQKERSMLVWEFVNEYTSKLSKPYNIIDIGGGIGGILDPFKKEANCYLFDYNRPFLKKANEMGIKTIEGGIDKIKLIDKPDFIILSHVLEHMPNINQELKNLTKQLKIGTMVYIELPGIDSLKEGRRGFDFLGDILKPHVYYFSIGTLTNLLERYGFECVKINSRIASIFKYSGIKKPLENHHNTVSSLIRSAERRRKIGIMYFIKCLSSIIPKNIRIKLKKIL